jgi:aldose 1-epimerase
MTLETNEKDGMTFVKIANDAGLSLTLCDHGASIYEIVYDGKKMSLAEQDVNAWKESDAYFGKTVGRIAGRIENAELHYLGKVYPLEPSEGKTCLHSGPKGFAHKNFRMDIVHLEDGVAVDFYLVSPALEGGFPGEVNLRVRYFIYESKSVFKIMLQSKVSEQTPLNITNHSYFNIGGEKNVEHQKLWIKAHSNQTYSKILMPLGFSKSTVATDFSKAKEIGKDINAPELYETRTKGYDHCYKIEENDGKSPVVSLENETYKMEIITSYPCIQIYSHNYPHEGEMLNTGYPCELHSGLAIEPVYAPNDFHTQTVLPFEGRKNFIEYVFSKKE